MGREKLLALIFLLHILIFTASAIEFNMNASSLPYSSNITLNFDINKTTSVEYGMFLTGPTEINYTNNTNETIIVEINLPIDTQPGSYQSYVMVGNNTEDVNVNIINDIIFGFSISKEYCFVGDEISFVSTGPQGSNVSIEINDDIINTVPGTTKFTPTKEKEYNVKATITFRNKTEVFEESFGAYKKLVCSITAKSSAYKNESVLFNGEGAGGVGTLSYLWTADDITKDENHATFSFEETGEKNVILKVTDKKDNFVTCKKTIEINERLYDIKIVTIDNNTGKVLGDVNVTINSTTKKTNVNGKALFSSIPKDTYSLSASRSNYMDYDNTISVGNNTEFEIRMFPIPEDKKPVPKVTLLSPNTNQIIRENNVVFTYKVSSQSRVDKCYLLINEVNNLGYKVRGTETNVDLDTELNFIVDLPNEKYKWTVQCENIDGINKSIDWFVTVLGEVPEEKEVETVKQLPQPSLTVFNKLIEDIDLASSKNYGTEEQLVYDVLGLKSTFTSNKADVVKLRDEMKNLASLRISEIDRTKKKNEILSELEKIKNKIPKDIVINEKKKYVMSANEDTIRNAAKEYITWRNYSLSDREINKYVKSVIDIQDEMKVVANVISAKIIYLNDAKQQVSVIKKDIKLNKTTGIIFIESISKIIAEDVDSLDFNVPYELVNKDPVVRIYPDEHPSFSYFTYKKIDFSDTNLTSSILLLDLNNPQNKITGFSIMNTSSSTSTFLLIFILLGVILGGNYFIFFRDENSRKLAISKIKQAGTNIKPKSNTKKLTIVLNEVVDLLKEKKTKEALFRYPQVLELYDKADKKICDELHPIISHLHYELEIYNVNQLIEEAYTKTLQGKSYEAVLPFDEIQEILYHIPDAYENKINPKLKNLSLQIEIHHMKEHNVILPRGDITVDDSLFQTKK